MAEAAPQQAPETVRLRRRAGSDLAPAEAEAALRQVTGFALTGGRARGEDGRAAPHRSEEAAQALGSYQNRLTGPLAARGAGAAGSRWRRAAGARAAAAGWFRAGTGGASDEFFSRPLTRRFAKTLPGSSATAPGATMAGEGPCPRLGAGHRRLVPAARGATRAAACHHGRGSS